MQPLRARVDQGAMAIMGFSAFPTDPAFLEPYHQIILCQDTRCGSLRDAVSIFCSPRRLGHLSKGIYFVAIFLTDTINILFFLSLYFLYSFIVVCMKKLSQLRGKRQKHNSLGITPKFSKFISGLKLYYKYKQKCAPDFSDSASFVGV